MSKELSSMRFSQEFNQLPPDIQLAMYSDATKSPGGENSSFNINGVQGSMFAPTEGGAQLIGPMGLPPAAAAIDAAQGGGAFSQMAAAPAPEAPAPQPGALSQVAQQDPFKLPTPQEALAMYMPNDGSQARYLAMAAGFGKETQTGSFGAQLGNVAASVQQQKMEQDKLRMQYLPQIMQQVTAQQLQMYQMRQNDIANAALAEANNGGNRALAQGQPSAQAMPGTQGAVGSQPGSPVTPQASDAAPVFIPRQVPPMILAQLRALPLNEQPKAREEIVKEYYTPKYENINGNMVITNDARFKPGFQGGMTTSADGTTVLSTPNASGTGVTISVPPGALEAKTAYLNAGEQAKAAYDLVDVPDGKGGMMKVPRAQAIAAMGGGSAPPNAPQPSGAPPAPGMVPARAGQSTPASGLPGPGQLGYTPTQAELDALKTTATAAASSGQKYQDTLHDKVEQDYQLVSRNARIAPLLDSFSTGGLAPEERVRLGSIVQNSGLLPQAAADKLSSWISSGDPSIGKTIDTQLASAGISTLINTLDNAGKPNRAEFAVINDAKESLKSGNATLKNLFELQRRVYDIHFNEQQALTSAIKSNSYDPRTWAGDYSAIRNKLLDAPQAPLPSQVGASTQPVGSVDALTNKWK